MTIRAEIVADSVSAEGHRLTTLQLRYPRFIHAEFMTHRVFSRNASSSRAIPVAKLIEDVERDPAEPLYWGKNQTGMQARHELDVISKAEAFNEWDLARVTAIDRARAMHTIGAHKQIVNRLLEPFAHINVVVTATEWDNFFELRRHPDAQPEIQALANAMAEAMSGSTPKLLTQYRWHLPYVDEEEQRASQALGLKLSTARCARVSYLTHEGKPPETQADCELYDRLVASVPLHASPAEHQAKPDVWVENDRGGQWGDHLAHGNFRGWIQHRKLIERQSL